MIKLASKLTHQLGKKNVLGGICNAENDWWLNHMFKIGAMENIDVVGIHGFPGTWNRNWRGWSLALDNIQRILDQYDSKAKIWITEAGFSSLNNGEGRQIKIFHDLLQAIENKPNITRIYWYSAQDLDPIHPTVQEVNCGKKDALEYHMGLFRRDGTKKPLATIWENAFTS